MTTEITWRAFDPSKTLEALVQRKAQTLTRYCDRLGACRITIEQRHRRHRRGQRYHVRIELDAPGAELVVGHLSEEDGAHEDVRVALRDAFRAMRRRLQQHLEMRRARVSVAAVLA